MVQESMVNFSNLKYKTLTRALCVIHKEYVSLDKKESDTHTKIVLKIVNQIITQMKKIDPLFNELYEDLKLGGSIADHLKIGEPDEYDLDIILAFPSELRSRCTDSNIPSYVHVQFENQYALTHPENKYRKLMDFVRDDYLLVGEIRRWVRSILDKTLNDMKDEHGRINVNGFSFTMNEVRDAGPAFNFKISSTNADIDFTVSIDFVPAFSYLYEKLPHKYCVRRQFIGSPVSVVTKLPKLDLESRIRERYWRLSLHEQERDLLKHKYWLKPTIRMFKILRDNLRHHHILCSYNIKTVFLWAVQEEKTEFWKTSFSECFLFMLCFLISYLEKENIPFYWNRKNNLIEHFPPEHRQNVANKWKKIYKEIKSNPDARIIAKHLLNEDDERLFLENFNISKRYRRNYRIDD